MWAGVRSWNCTKVSIVDSLAPARSALAGLHLRSNGGSRSCQVFPELELSLSRQANLSPLPKALKSRKLNNSPIEVGKGRKGRKGPKVAERQAKSVELDPVKP